MTRTNKYKSSVEPVSGKKKLDCTYSLTLVPWRAEKYRDAKQRLQQRVLWNEPVLISQLCTLHGGLCAPSSQNLVDVRSSSGTYSRSLPHNALYSLCRIVDSGTSLNINNVTASVSPVWPKNKPITKDIVQSIKRKVLPVYRQIDSYRSFINFMTESDLISGIDDDDILDDKEAYKSHTIPSKVSLTVMV